MPIDRSGQQTTPTPLPRSTAPLRRMPLGRPTLSLPLPDPADRVAVHRANRAQADGIYAAHRAEAYEGTTWAEAVPSPWAAWEQHQDRYPERERATPQTHPDNSWSSGEARRLTPEQNAEATKACADIHDEGERVIFPAMRQIEAADPTRRLAGLEHMLKGADRLKEKIAERLRYHPDLAPRQAAVEVPDAVRFTLEYSESHYTKGVLADVERLKGAGYELLKLKNLWAKDQYKGVNSQWLRPETGLRFEVQFHTPQSREAKELTHKAYERLRDPLTSKAEETELEAFQRRVNALVKRPPDVFRIEDYPPEKRDG